MISEEKQRKVQLQVHYEYICTIEQKKTDKLIVFNAY